MDFDARLREADPERWLSSRFVADEGRRADLVVLYGFEAELMAIPSRVTQPLLAEMRYRWWADQMDGVFAGAPRKGHPLLEALSVIIERHGLERAPFDALIEAHVGRLHGVPHDLSAFYVGPMLLAVRMLAGPGHEAAGELAGHVRGLIQTGRLDEARGFRPRANAALKALPVAAFPAVAPATLFKPDEREALKRLRLVWAMLRGRI